jgi:GTP diphosphokinase / guanosine-3',5'-bis(diphosphate) 3'-diphosphatase
MPYSSRQVPGTSASICSALVRRAEFIQVNCRFLNGQLATPTPRRDKMAKEWITVLRAADAAAKWHVHQRRKGPAKEPYVNHLLEVATLVAEATEGKDPDLVIAALLHDAIEDQEVPRNVIAETFGEDVAKLVEAVTDDKSLDWQVNKKKQIENARKASHRAKILKLADKTANLKTLAASPPRKWSVKRRLEYVEWSRKVAEGLTGVSEWLEREFEQATKEAERSTVFRR